MRFHRAACTALALALVLGLPTAAAAPVEDDEGRCGGIFQCIFRPFLNGFREAADILWGAGVGTPLSAEQARQGLDDAKESLAELGEAAAEKVEDVVECVSEGCIIRVVARAIKAPFVLVGDAFASAGRSFEHAARSAWGLVGRAFVAAGVMLRGTLESIVLAIKLPVLGMMEAAYEAAGETGPLAPLVTAAFGLGAAILALSLIGLGIWGMKRLIAGGW